MAPVHEVEAKRSAHVAARRSRPTFAVNDRWRTLVESRSARPRRPNGDGFALLGRRKDGSEFPVDVAMNPYTGDEGCAVVSGRDITARRALEESERLAKEMFAAVISSSQYPSSAFPPEQCVAGVESRG